MMIDALRAYWLRIRRPLKWYLLPILTAFTYSPFVVLVTRLFQAVAPGDPHSTRNDLLFSLAPADSPLCTTGHYPVPITAGVVPKRTHSHNDYVQSIPLLKALSYGAGSIEADIWLIDDELYVGHDAEDIRPERTLNALYLDPLMSIIKTANEGNNSGRLKGVWETAPNLPLHLLIDIKTDGPTTFEKLYRVLAPFRELGYLTTWTADSKAAYPTSSLITVIGTGNTPLASVAATGHTPDTPRDVFLDAVLDLIPEDTAGVYVPSLCPLASSDFGKSVGQTWTIPGLARPRIRRLTQAAHARGIQARFWRTPGMPVAARNAVWQMLLDEGVDWLNVDDLPASKYF